MRFVKYRITSPTIALFAVDSVSLAVRIDAWPPRVNDLFNREGWRLLRCLSNSLAPHPSFGLPFLRLCTEQLAHRITDGTL